MNIFFIGDIVGRVGRNAVKEILPEITSKYKIDFVVGNGENAAGGFGMTRRVAEELFSYGIDVLTMGNHTWDNKSILSFIDNEHRIIRPLNYNDNVPGKGWTIIKKENVKICIMNFIGQVFMNGNNSPFDSFDQNFKEIKEKSDIILIDFHGEATGEKLAFANYVDGKVSTVVGTHTHIQTSDNMILSQGTAYITDLGMSGASNSILGMSKMHVIEGFRSQISHRYKVAKGDFKIEGVVTSINEKTGLSNNIIRIRVKNK